MRTQRSLPKMGRFGNNGSQTNIRRHWICKDCETANEKSRLKCLSCDKSRKEVEIQQQDHERVWKRLGLDDDYSLGITMSDKEITKDWVKTNYDHGEYP